MLGILSGESYSGIRTLVDLSNKLSGAVIGETATELTTNLA